MTTFEEISACPVANKAFWTEHAICCLTCYRIHKRDGNVSDARLERHGFRKNMAGRRNKTFLDIQPSQRRLFA